MITMGCTSREKRVWQSGNDSAYSCSQASELRLPSLRLSSVTEWVSEKIEAVAERYWK